MRLSTNPKNGWYMNCWILYLYPHPALSIIALCSVVGIGLGQVLLQELQVFLGSTSNTLLSGSGSGNVGGSRSGSQDGLGGVELRELGGKIRRQSRCLGSGRGGVRLDAREVGVGVLRQ
jgi:hypothetical protein